MKTTRMTGWIVPLLAAALVGCTANETRTGEGGTMVSGSGGAAGSQGESARLVRCQRPIGTAALLEPESASYAQYGLKSPVPLIKLMMAQSGCFKVVARGASSSALQRERAMAAGGDMQKGSNMGGGQMVAADYIIQPEILYQDANAGGGVGALLPGFVGVVAGGIKTRNLEAQVLLSLINVRTGVQEAVAEGSAKKRDIGFGIGGWAGGIAGVGGGYEDTDIGKITAAALLDAHNKLVGQVQAMAPGAREADNAGYVTAARVNFRSGPNTGAPILSSLAAGTSVRPTGTRQGDWWEVEAAGRTGWIHSDYITR